MTQHKDHEAGALSGGVPETEATTLTVEGIEDIDQNLAFVGHGTFEIAEEDWNAVRDTAIGAVALQEALEKAVNIGLAFIGSTFPDSPVTDPYVKETEAKLRALAARSGVPSKSTSEPNEQSGVTERLCVTPTPQERG